MDILKRCKGCNTDQPLSNFYPYRPTPLAHPDPADPLHYRPRCQSCEREAQRLRYEALPPERKAEVVERQRVRRADDPDADHRRTCERHGVTPEWYAETLAAQGGGCAVCGVPECATGRRFAIDHDHRHCPGPKGCAECVRGLLCRSCNVGIGYLGDAPERLQAAADYLRHAHRDSSTDRAPGTGP